MNTINGQPITFGGAGSSTPEIFGDGSDGVGLFTANTTWNAETEDTGMIVKNFESLTISEGVTVSAGNRNCGMIVRVKGDCTIAGSLVNKLSCKTILDSDGVDFTVYPASMLNGAGGAGGKGGSQRWASGGTGMAGRIYGGGWSGGGAGAGYGGAGGSAENITTATGMFVGGKGRVISYGSDISNPTAGKYGGGGGGDSTSSGTLSGTGHAGDGGSSAGAKGGTPTTDGGIGFGGGGGAGNIGGGVIILLVGGNLTITGSIDCSGSAGGAGGTYRYAEYDGSGGGGSGGGRIFICHKGDISNTGTFNVNGGAGGYGEAQSGYGSNSSAGTIGTTAVKTYEQYMEEDVA